MAVDNTESHTPCRVRPKISAISDMEESTGSSSIMLLIYAVMAMSIVALPFFYFAMYSGFLRFVLAFLCLTILVLFLSARMDEAVAVSREKSLGKKLFQGAGAGLSSTHRTVQRAFHGFQSSQLTLRDVLRDVLVRRLSVSLRMEIEEIENMCLNGRVSSLIQDPELQELLRVRNVRPVSRYSRGWLAGMFGKKRVDESTRIDDYREWLDRIMQKIDEI